MRVDQFFVLSGRGDSLVNKVYKRDHPRGCPDMYYRQMQFGHTSVRGERTIYEDPAPIFVHENLFKFVHVQRNGLYFVAVVAKDYSLADNVLSWLNSFSKTVKDFLGMLCEDTVRVNVVLLYELLDESLDPNGNFKTTNTSALKSMIYSTPQSANSEESNLPSQLISSAADALSNAVTSSGLDISSFKRSFDTFLSPKSLPAYASHRSIINTDVSNEVFLDIVEHISAIVSPDGTASRVSISGNTTVKSFLNWNRPTKLKIKFCNNLVMGRKCQALNQGLGGLYASNVRENEVTLDHAIFANDVDAGEFSHHKTIYTAPGVGERTLMSYRVGGSSIQNKAQLPITFKTDLQRIRKNYLELSITLIPNSHILKGGAGSVIAMVPLPPEWVGITCNSTFYDSRTSKVFTTVAFPGEALGSNGGTGNAWDSSMARVSVCDYERDHNRVVWKIPKFNTHEVGTLKIQIDLPSDSNSYSELKAQVNRIGPMRLCFDLPTFTASGINVVSLKLMDSLTNREINPATPIEDKSLMGGSAMSNNGPLPGLIKPAASHYRWVRYLTKGTNYTCHLGLSL